MTTCLGKSCSFGLPRVPFVNCCQFMYLVISLLVLSAECGIWLYQFRIIAYLFTFIRISGGLMSTHCKLVVSPLIYNLKLTEKNTWHSRSKDKNNSPAYSAMPPNLTYWMNRTTCEMIPVSNLWNNDMTGQHSSPESHIVNKTFDVLDAKHYDSESLEYEDVLYFSSSPTPWHVPWGH